MYKIQFFKLKISASPLKLWENVERILEFVVIFSPFFRLNYLPFIRIKLGNKKLLGRRRKIFLTEINFFYFIKKRFITNIELAGGLFTIPVCHN